MTLLYVLLLLQPLCLLCQDYSVTDIQCSQGEQGGVSATLRKPPGFLGAPIFADARDQEPETSEVCSIRGLGDTEGLLYGLRVSDLTSCGVVTRNGFVSLRIWFPKLPRVVMMSDQEVIIMCKPPQAPPSSQQQVSMAGLFPSRSRVSGSLPRPSGPLVYTVALYREEQGGGEKEAGQGVAIGSLLQLRASVDTGSVWQWVRLVEVVLSPSREEARAPGSVALVREGCREEQFSSIVPRQQWRPDNTTAEVGGDGGVGYDGCGGGGDHSCGGGGGNGSGGDRGCGDGGGDVVCRDGDCLVMIVVVMGRVDSLTACLYQVRLEFEAVLLDASRAAPGAAQGRLWVHATTLACRTEGQCRLLVSSLAYIYFLVL